MAISLHGIQGVLFPGATVRVAIQLVIMIFICFLLYGAAKHLESLKFEGKSIVNSYIWYGFFIFIHSAYISDTYEQWRFLVTVYGPTMLFGFFCIFGTSYQNFVFFIGMLLKITLPMSLIFWISGPGDKISNAEYLRYTSFAYLLIILSPILSGWQKHIGMFVAILGIYFDPSNRSNILSVFASVLIFLFYTWMLKIGKIGFYISRKVATYISIALIVVPLIFLALGASGTFNVFEKMEESADIVVLDAGDGRKNNVDSRSVIYADAYNSLNNNGSWIFGNSATYRYETGLALTLEDYTEGRLSPSESFFLGHLMFGGVVYIIIFLLLIIAVVYYGIKKSNSILSQMLALSVAFKWFFSFIESPMDFNIYWVLSFMTFGVVLSKEFRSLDDEQIKYSFGKIWNFA